MAPPQPKPPSVREAIEFFEDRLRLTQDEIARLCGSARRTIMGWKSEKESEGIAATFLCLLYMHVKDRPEEHQGARDARARAREFLVELAQEEFPWQVLLQKGIDKQFPIPPPPGPDGMNEPGKSRP